MSPGFADVSRGHLLTEQANPRSSELDALSTAELVDVFVAEDLKPQQAVAQAAALFRTVKQLEAKVQELENAAAKAKDQDCTEGTEEKACLSN